MSMQLSVRFYANLPESQYESNLLSHCYDLFEEVKDLLGVQNILAVPFTIHEEELYEQIEADLGGEPEEETDAEGFDTFEETLETELSVRGEFFSLSDLRSSVLAYREYFQLQSDETFDLGYNRSTCGKLIAEDLGSLQQELERLPEGKARLVIG
ncbi:hypothetical protein [Lyngbya confervoides]|uniref:Uncharacterized protein n=1 Tax=Lyngbya confervoides BDU141951 TaxID=1574623 RepID=A0ABD4SYY2_9CYAN|nr:hypothetical protein [Lyngbya confervoides]MCM1981609.1 hypothetical protein [Lyngbya confervoides BDU141951]